MTNPLDEARELHEQALDRDLDGKVRFQALADAVGKLIEAMSKPREPEPAPVRKGK